MQKIVKVAESCRKIVAESCKIVRKKCKIFNVYIIYRMVQKYCPMKYEFSVDQASDTKILNQYKIIIHHLRLSDTKSVEKTIIA